MAQQLLTQLSPSQRAMWVAERARPGQSYVDLASRADTGVAMVQRAFAVLRLGTAEDIAAARAGTDSVSVLAQRLWRMARIARRAAEKPPGVVIELPQGYVAHNVPKLPPGVTPEAVARQAIELRKTLSSVDLVAEQLGVRRMTLVPMMDIVMIADRRDLSERDEALARDALAAMNESRAPVERILAAIAPIKRRLWGDEVRGGLTREHHEAKRQANFQRALGVLTQSCTNGVLIELPHLSPEQAKEVLGELYQARRDVEELTRRVRELHR